jgi:putative membrane protein
MQTEKNLVLEKRLNLVAYIFSAIVLLLVGGLRSLPKIDLGVDFTFLPPFHASLNALAAVFLVLAFFYVKQGDYSRHSQMIYIAMFFSALFLISYVLYHATSPEIIYGDANHDGLLSAEEKAAVGSSRTVYLLLLATHIVLAGGILPFILLTFNRAYTHQYARHKKMAKWVFPLWLYVAVTGPLCFWMLKPYYQ